MYALQDLGWTDSHTTDFEPHAAAGLVPARVAAQHRGAYVLFSELGELRAETAGRLAHEADSAGDLPAVGDWVAVAPRPEERAATIQHVVSRRTKFSRKVALDAARTMAQIRESSELEERLAALERAMGPDRRIG